MLHSSKTVTLTLLLFAHPAVSQVLRIGMGVMEDAKIDGTPFSVLMQQAVKLKTHIHKIDRVKFDRWPKFYQNSAFVKDEQRLERQLPYSERIKVATNYKKLGDQKFLDGNFLEAGLNYEWALGLFKWATPQDPNWRQKSVDDSFMKEEEFLGESEAEKQTIRHFRVTCYLNLARTYFKQKELDTARHCCDWALALDGNCDKALLLRARCLVESASHGATERDQAIFDLEQAERLCKEPNRLREVRTFLRNLKQLKTVGKRADQQYAGLFERGEVYDPDETEKRRQHVEDHVEDEDKKPGVDAELAAAERLMRQYEEEGNTAQVEELRRAIEQTRAKLTASPPRLDFRNPTKQMREDATRRGIDLDDPRVLDMLEQLQLEKEDPQLAQRRADLETKLNAMSMATMLSNLDRLQVDHSDCSTKAELRNKLMAALLDSNQPLSSPDSSSQSITNLSTWKVTLTIAFVLAAYRLYNSKLTMPLIKALFFGEQLEDPLRASDFSTFHRTSAIFEEDDAEWDDEF